MFYFLFSHSRTATEARKAKVAHQKRPLPRVILTLPPKPDDGEMEVDELAEDDFTPVSSKTFLYFFTLLKFAAL